MSRKQWPEYRLDIPKRIELTCPECGTVHVCDVDIDEDAAGVLDQAVAVAKIDTDFCEACNKPLCSKCPDSSVDGLRFCMDCQEEAQEAADEVGVPMVRFPKLPEVA